MSNNTVINHDTYAEITNGLFFTNVVISEVNIEEPERRENERPNRFHNMSEQEILNYLDQISQEE